MAPPNPRSKNAEGLLKGVAFTDKDSRILFHSGAASDVRLRAIFSDEDWIREAAERRIPPSR